MANILAARINNLQSRIELILGTGAGQNGYGQPVLSSNVLVDGGATDDIIYASDLNTIYEDMIKARIHQVGLGNEEIAEVVQNLNVIAEEESFFVSDEGVTSADPEGELKGLADFERLMTKIEADKFKVHTSQAIPEPAISSTRTTTWNGLLFHEVEVTFDDEEQRRYFFNTGGEIRISATNTNASTPKGLDWAALCNEIGVIKFTYDGTTSTGDGSGSSIGNYDLDGSSQVIYQKVGSGTYSGIYAGNLYTIKARLDGGNRIVFRIEFNDVAVDNAVDNQVDGRLESVIEHYRAHTSYVSVDAPSYYNRSTLA